MNENELNLPYIAICLPDEIIVKNLTDVKKFMEKETIFSLILLKKN
jgi:hypothetical protein